MDATLEEITNTVIEDLTTALSSKMEAYFNEVLSEEVSRQQYKQLVAEADFTEFGAEYPRDGGIYRVDIYDGPNGKGWVVFAVVEDGEQIFQKALKVGEDEVYKNEDWKEI